MQDNTFAPHHEGDRWLTEKAVASLTGLSVHTLRAYRQRGVGIPYAKIGRSVRYLLEDIQTWMKSRRIVVPRP